MTVYLSNANAHYGSVSIATRKALSGKTSARADAPSRRSAPADEKASQSTRERILDSATRLFAEHGFESASMPAIAKASGITAGAIYKHFESKGDLLLEVVKRSFLSSPLFAHGSVTENDATALPYLAAAYTEPALKLVRQLSIEVHSASTMDAKVRQVLSQSDKLAMKGIAESIAAAQRAGKLDPNLDPEHTARVFCVFIMGLIHMDTLLPDLIGDASWREFVRERIAMLIGGR